METAISTIEYANTILHHHFDANTHYLTGIDLMQLVALMDIELRTRDGININEHYILKDGIFFPICLAGKFHDQCRSTIIMKSLIPTASTTGMIITDPVYSTIAYLVVHLYGNMSVQERAQLINEKAAFLPVEGYPGLYSMHIM